MHYTTALLCAESPSPVTAIVLQLKGHYTLISCSPSAMALDISMDQQTPRQGPSSCNKPLLDLSQPPQARLPTRCSATANLPYRDGPLPTAPPAAAQTALGSVEPSTGAEARTVVAGDRAAAAVRAGSAVALAADLRWTMNGTAAAAPVYQAGHGIADASVRLKRRPTKKGRHLAQILILWITGETQFIPCRLFYKERSLAGSFWRAFWSCSWRSYDGWRSDIYMLTSPEVAMV